MRVPAAIAICILLGSCEQRTPAISDVMFNEVRATYPGMSKDCLDKIRYGGFEAQDTDDPTCFEWTSPQRWRGLWRVGFEWTNFCPEPARNCAVFFVDDERWMKWEEGAGPAPLGAAEGLYQIEFVGRRTKVPGHFGHLNQYPRMMMVERLISIRKVPEPAEQSGK